MNLMKKFVRILSLLLCLCLLMGVGTLFVAAAPATITGQTQAITKNIQINGTDTGVAHTQILLEKGSAYSLGTTGLVNLIEITPSSKVAMKVLNGGSYNWSQATMGKSALVYNSTHKDSTLLAAVNGDPWLVYHKDYDGDGNKNTGEKVKHVSVSRGIMVIEGELWNSHQIDDENKLAYTDDAERSTPAAQGPAIGFKADGTAITGTPRVSVSIQNLTTNHTHTAGGVNRLPAPNSIILYNQRIGTESFAMTDAYEIYLECESSAFTVATDKTTTGRVVGVYKSGETNRPAITEKTVIISARGTSIKQVQDKYTIGDEVAVTCKISNDLTILSQRKDWADCMEITGGFFYLLDRGQEKGQPGNATNYPCSIIGMKQDGTVLMASTTSTEDGTRSACQMQNLPKLCKELGFHTAILFDGGGSTTMISLDGNSYVRRSSTPDGGNSVRPVISGLAVVYNGVDIEPTNKESNNRADFFGNGPDVPETPDKPAGVDFAGTPSYSYRYYTSIATINGADQENLFGRRDPAYSSSWTSEQKLASIQPGVVSDGVTVNENNQIILSGYSFVNGGQGDHYWSVDKENWYLCTNGVFTDADAEQEKFATTEGNLNSSSVTDARFENLTADLSAHAGETVTVYFGINAKHDTTKMCHYLTIENVAIPAGAPVMWDEKKDVVLHQSFDELRINDTTDGLFTPGQSAGWDKTASVDGSVTSISYWGWVALNAEIGSFGYQIDDGEPIWSADFAFETEQGVLDAIAGVSGATGASRMLIKIDISALDGEHTIRAMYKNPADKAVILGEFTLTRDADAFPETEPETDPVTTPVESTPETLPAETTAETPAESSGDTTDETALVVTGEATETETPASDGGCASSVLAVSGILLAAVACAFVSKKRD